MGGDPWTRFAAAVQVHRADAVASGVERVREPLDVARRHPVPDAGVARVGGMGVPRPRE